jgi:hypothetical protein
MKRLLLILLLLPTLAFAQNSTDGGKVPLQGNQIGGVGPDGQFHFWHLANDGSLPVTTTDATATTVKSTALEASHVLKASTGSLVSLQVFNSGAAQYILVMDSATVPANGAVTLLCPPIYIGATTYIFIPFAVPLSAANGISVSNSSTGSFTKTIGAADCVYTGQIR